jgi:hypothetical protein
MVISRPGPPGNARVIEYRAHQRISSLVMNSPWLSKKNRTRLGLRVDINANCLAIVVRPVLDFQRASAHAQGRIGT